MSFKINMFNTFVRQRFVELVLAILLQCELVFMQIYITMSSWEGHYNQDAYEYLFHKLIQLVAFLSFLVNIVDMSLELLV
jgi:hypothetical protein